jgi:hypothetical protein
MAKKTVKKRLSIRKTKKHGGWLGESLYRNVHRLVRGKKSTGQMIKEVNDEINEISTLCANGANNIKNVQPRIKKVKETIQQSTLDENKKNELMDKIICKLPKTTKFKFIKKADSGVIELENPRYLSSANLSKRMPEVSSIPSPSKSRSRSRSRSRSSSRSSSRSPLRSTSRSRSRPKSRSISKKTPITIEESSPKLDLVLETPKNPGVLMVTDKTKSRWYKPDEVNPETREKNKKINDAAMAEAKKLEDCVKDPTTCGKNSTLRNNYMGGKF